MDTDPRATEKIEFQGVIRGDDNAKKRLYIMLEKSKETLLKFYKGTSKVFKLHINGWIQ